MVNRSYGSKKEFQFIFSFKETQFAYAVQCFSAFDAWAKQENSGAKQNNLTTQKNWLSLDRKADFQSETSLIFLE